MALTVVAGLSRPVVALSAASAAYLLWRAHARAGAAQSTESSDPRGLVDANPAEAVDAKTAGIALDLAAGRLLSTTPNLLELNLKKAGLTTLPPEIGTLKQLKKLDVSMSPLADFPDALGELSELRILFCLGCKFTSVPLVVGKLESLYSEGPCALCPKFSSCAQHSLTPRPALTPPHSPRTQPPARLPRRSALLQEQRARGDRRRRARAHAAVAHPHRQPPDRAAGAPPQGAPQGDAHQQQAGGAARRHLRLRRPRAHSSGRQQAHRAAKRLPLDAEALVDRLRRQPAPRARKRRRRRRRRPSGALLKLLDPLLRLLQLLAQRVDLVVLLTHQQQRVHRLRPRAVS
mmetsp:Transcript_48247/g.133732  ORF Transcript_48247/g.133732 Transcript_48247/m.133732 type:complete len:347 (+) Transcript_48247:111-1151(+)